MSRAPGPAGPAANACSGGPTTSADGRYVAFDSLATNLVAGTLAGVQQRLPPRRAGRRPGATPLCKTLPLPPAPPDKDDVVFTLSVTQLRINQRISQAAIRRLNAVEARLNGGLAGARPVRLLGRAARAGAGHHQRPGGRLAGAGLAGRPGRRSSTPAAAARATR